MQEIQACFLNGALPITLRSCLSTNEYILPSIHGMDNFFPT